MKFYAYKGDYEIGHEPCGTEGKLMFELKTTRGAIKRVRGIFKSSPFKLYTYTNFYDDNTFRVVDHD